MCVFRVGAHRKKLDLGLQTSEVPPRLCMYTWHMAGAGVLKRQRSYSDAPISDPFPDGSLKHKTPKTWGRARCGGLGEKGQRGLR